MVGAAAAVGAHWHPNERRHRKLTHAQVARFRQLLDQLIERGPDVVGKLYFDDGPRAYGRHARRAAHDVGLLNGRVEHAAVAVLFGQQRGFAKHAAQLASHVLAVEKRLREFPQNIVYGVQGGVYHQHFFGAGGGTLAGLGQHGGWRKLVVGEGSRVGVGRGQGSGPVGGHGGAGLLGQGGELGFAKARVQQAAVQAGQRVVLLVLGEVVAAVPLAAHAAGVVAQQRALGVHQRGPAPLPHVRKRGAQPHVRRHHIGPIDAHPVQARKAGGKVVGIHGAHFLAGSRDAPVVVLHQVHDGQAVQNGHLQGLAHLALRHGPVADRAQHQRPGAGRTIPTPLFGRTFEVSQRLGHAGGRNGLHTGGRALVGYHGQARSPQAGVAVVGAPAAEGVVALGQQLQHQLVGAQAQAQQQGIVAVVGGSVVVLGKQECRRQLHSLVAAGGGVHVAGGHGFLRLVEGRHLDSRVHERVSAGEQVGFGHGRDSRSRRGRSISKHEQGRKSQWEW